MDSEELVEHDVGRASAGLMGDGVSVVYID